MYCTPWDLDGFGVPRLWENITEIFETEFSRLGTVIYSSPNLCKFVPQKWQRPHAASANSALDSHPLVFETPLDQGPNWGFKKTCKSQKDKHIKSWNLRKYCMSFTYCTAPFFSIWSWSERPWFRPGCAKRHARSNRGPGGGFIEHAIPCVVLTCTAGSIEAPWKNGYAHFPRKMWYDMGPDQVVAETMGKK